MSYLNNSNYLVNLRNMLMMARQLKRNHRAYNFRLPFYLYLSWLYICNVLLVAQMRVRKNFRRSILLQEWKVYVCRMKKQTATLQWNSIIEGQYIYGSVRQHSFTLQSCNKDFEERKQTATSQWNNKIEGAIFNDQFCNIWPCSKITLCHVIYCTVKLQL